jgi:hypothetical protein
MGKFSTSPSIRTSMSASPDAEAVTFMLGYFLGGGFEAWGDSDLF